MIHQNLNQNVIVTMVTVTMVMVTVVGQDTEKTDGTNNPFGEDVHYEDEVTEMPITIETVVWYPLRIWHLGAMVSTFITIIIVILCCCFDCRVPRTKEQITADKEKKKMVTKYTQEMNELCFGTAGTRMVVPPLDPSRQKKPVKPGETRVPVPAVSTNRYLPT